MKKDYYEILGVPRDATAQVIKKKYRSLALKYHPDRVEQDKKAESEERFKEISEAYGVLSDPKKRQMYDQYGHAGIDQNFTSEDIFRGADFGDLGDIFSQFFGGGGGGGGGFGDMFGGSRQRGPARGRDIQYEIDITLEEAYKGVHKKIKVPRYEYCKPCDGNGSKNGTSLQTCATCNGAGVVSVASGFFRMQQHCPQCHGQGKMIKEACPECSGQGRKKITRTIDVQIPAGVDNSSRLRVSGEGELDKGGPGDLYLYIHVLKHDTFQRDHHDLYMELPVSFVKAALGAEISVPVIEGKITMNVPAGTQSGKKFRLKGKGMPDLRTSHHGDLYVQVMLEVPKKLTTEQKEILEKYAQVSGEKVGIKNESITDKIKKVFK